jgi:hypothetical protein
LLHAYDVITKLLEGLFYGFFKIIPFPIISYSPVWYFSSLYLVIVEVLYILIGLLSFRKYTLAMDIVGFRRSSDRIMTMDLNVFPVSVRSVPLGECPDRSYCLNIHHSRAG